MDYYESRKVHGSIDELGTRLIFGSCVVRNGIIRSILQPVFEFTTKACLSAEDLAGPVGLGVVNAQPLTAEVVHRFLRSVPTILEERGYIAIALIAGDSIYLCIPWTNDEAVMCMTERVNVYFRRYHKSQKSELKSKVMKYYGLTGEQEMKIGRAKPDHS